MNDARSRPTAVYRRPISSAVHDVRFRQPSRIACVGAGAGAVVEPRARPSRRAARGHGGSRRLRGDERSNHPHTSHPWGTPTPTPTTTPTTTAPPYRYPCNYHSPYPYSYPTVSLSLPPPYHLPLSLFLPLTLLLPYPYSTTFTYPYPYPNHPLKSNHDPERDPNLSLPKDNFSGHSHISTPKLAFLGE
eukprot:6195325-Pleurochrysis_carterae.AAC.2